MMLIDFREIKTGHDFEKFAQLFLERLGFKILRGAAIGADGGVDIICEEPSSYGQFGRRWLVSCKHLNRNVGQYDDKADVNKLIEHNCSAFMFVYSSNITESLRQSVEKVSHQKGCNYHFFEPRAIENIIISFPRFIPLLHQFFPLSHNRYIGLINMDVNCCPYGGSPQDGIYAVYVRDEKTQKMTVKVFSDCCIDNYLGDLDYLGIEYGVCTLKERAFLG